MKLICISVLSVVLIGAIPGPGAASIEPGTTELSLGGSFNHWKIGEESGQTNLSLYVRGGRIFPRRVGAEVECFFTSLDDKAPGLVLSACITYNLSYVTSSGPVSIFLLGGVGVSNSMPFLGHTIWMSSSSQYDMVLNAGAGTRLPLTESASIRLEYRYQRFNADEGADSHLVLMGISILFRPRSGGV